ncbi:MAG: hypothetical protein GYB68_12720 [Chloroflexi bacterium]|nr:hypothetical protein [Chloroflexota bacterium]
MDQAEIVEVVSKQLGVNYVLAFDGRVLEIFQPSDSTRVHVNSINSVELERHPRRSVYRLKLKIQGIIATHIIEEMHLPKAERFVSAVTEAIQTYDQQAP